MTASEIIAALSQLTATDKAAVLVALVADLAQPRPAPIAPTGGSAPSLVDANTLASMLQLPKTHLMAFARQKKIPSVKAGKYVRFDASEVEAALRNHASK